MAVPLIWGEGGKGLAIKTKIYFFGTIFYLKNKVPAAIKLEGGGGLGKALMTLSLRKYILFLFLRLPLNEYP